jgi:CRISPR/Cas system-associated exonuclease Cas4 (RecB family)
MRKARGLLAHSPAIAISMLALVFALGSGAGYATSTAGSTGNPVFHNLRVDGKWRGQLKYTVVDGVVYLTGPASISRQWATQLATLPASLAPKDQLNIPITFGVKGDGFVQVNPDGKISPIAPSTGPINDVSLDGVSFPIGS